MAAEIQSTQDKYTRADKTNEPPQIKENEVRITTRGRVKKYVDYATRLFQGGQDNEENKQNQDNQSDNGHKGPSKQFDTIVLKATGKAINKAVTTAEVVKRTIGDLHQETTLETLEIVDVWEPKEEGLQKVETTRRVASISIKLSRKVDDVDINAPGYQKPIAQETGFNLGYRGNTRRGGYNRRGNFRGGGRGRNQDNRRGGGQGRRNFNNRGQGGQGRNFNNRGGYGRGGYGNQGNPYSSGGGGGTGYGRGGNNNFNRGPRQGGPGGNFGQGGGYNRPGGNFGSPRRNPRYDGRRGRGGPRRGGYNY